MLKSISNNLFLVSLLVLLQFPSCGGMKALFESGFAAGNDYLPDLKSSDSHKKKGEDLFADLKKELPGTLKEREPDYDLMGSSLVSRHHPELLLIRDHNDQILYNYLSSPDFREARRRLLLRLADTHKGTWRQGDLRIMVRPIQIGKKRFVVAAGFDVSAATALLSYLRGVGKGGSSNDAEGALADGRRLPSRRLLPLVAVFVLCTVGVILLLIGIVRFSTPLSEQMVDAILGSRRNRLSFRSRKIGKLRVHLPDSLRGESLEADGVAGVRKKRGGASPGFVTGTELEQERWNIPAIQNLLGGFPPRHFDYSALKGGEPMFNHHFFRLNEIGSAPAHMADTESLVRAFLLRMGKFLPEDLILFLKNEAGAPRPVVRLQGETFLFDEAIQVAPLAGRVWKELLKGNSVVAAGENVVYLPLTAQQETVGALLFCGGRIHDREELSRIWLETCKFGEQLFQMKLFELASLEPESSLLNGIQFFNDLNYEYSLRRELRERRGLLLMHFAGRTDLDNMRRPGQLLHTRFPSPFRHYRISREVFALLGPTMGPAEVSRACADYLKAVRTEQAVDICLGGAVLDDDIQSPQHWFDAAGRALEEAWLTGLNHYRLHRRFGSGRSYDLTRS